MTDPVRSDRLADLLVATLPERPRLLFAEPGDMAALGWLALRIGRAQRWTIADTDSERLDDAIERLALWAHQRRLTTTWPARALLIHAPGGAWRIEAVTNLPATLVDVRIADAVLVDRAPPDADVWQAYRAPDGRPPLLACLCPSATPLWLPPRRDDHLVRLRYGRPDGAAQALRAAGCVVHGAVTDLHVARSVSGQMHALVEDVAEAAISAAPARRARIATWRATRLRQSLRGQLAARIAYRDVLAFPPAWATVTAGGPDGIPAPQRPANQNRK